jgi:hypothetical protein
MGQMWQGNPTGVNPGPVFTYQRWGNKNKIVKAAGNITALTGNATVATGSAYDSAFFDCRKLEDISGLVFTDSGDQGNSFLQCAFEGCTALRTIPADLLPRELTNTNMFLYRTFQNSGIEIIPEGFLPAFTTVGTNFLAEAFSASYPKDALPLRAIPPDFIPRSLTTAPNYFLQNTFRNCVNLTSIPEGFAAHITNIGNYFLANTFAHCTGISAIPENFVPQNPTTIGNYFLSSTFGVTGVAAIPTNLIPDTYKTVTTGTYLLNGTFSGCNNLTTVDLAFINNLTVSNSNFLNACFRTCTNLREVHIPYIADNGKTALFNLMLRDIPLLATVSITGGGTSEVLMANQSAGMQASYAALTVYLDNADLVSAYQNSTKWSQISDDKFQVRPQEQ